MTNKVLAFFDFDGTITTSDSLIKFIRFVVGDVRFIYGLIILAPVLIFYKLKLIPNYKAKQAVLCYFFKGMIQEDFLQAANEYSLKHINDILRPKAMQKIRQHKDQGHKVVIVSASIECWIKPWCDKHDLDLISTKLEMAEGVVTGKFSTKNCYGVEKKHRIKEVYNLDDYDYIYAYGDSQGDLEMLGIADKARYKPFRKL
jgi:phosphatidylglycerophosphatase C